MSYMFMRTVKARGGAGVQHEYVRLVENYWEKGRRKQRVVVSLGRKDVLAPHLDSLVRMLGGEGERGQWIKVGELVHREVANWGPVLVAGVLWRELGLEAILDRLGGPAVADQAFVLVAHRLCRPGSEHRLAGWLETDYVCDRQGKRWLPPWEEHGRVQVNLSWLQRWYRTLDELLRYKEEVERAFRDLKDVIEMRPIYHRHVNRVRGHIFVAALAFLLERALEKKLKAAGVRLSPQEALEALETIHVVETQIGPQVKVGVNGGSPRAQRVLAALGISKLDPPQHPA